MAESPTERTRMWGQVYLELVSKGMYTEHARDIVMEMIRLYG